METLNNKHIRPSRTDDFKVKFANKGFKCKYENILYENIKKNRAQKMLKKSNYSTIC